MSSENSSMSVLSVSGTNPRRRRPPVSCALCRQRKIRCDRGVPCSNCVRTKNKNCAYQSSQQHQQLRNGGKGETPQPQIMSVQASQEVNLSPDRIVGASNAGSISTAPSGPSPTIDINSRPSLTPTSHSATSEIETLKSMIRHLEDQLAHPTKSHVKSPSWTPGSDFETTHSHLAGTFHIQNDSFPSNQGPTVRRSFIHKRRLFGQSHWINSMYLFRDVVLTMEPHLSEEGSKALLGLQKCKHLGRMIKAQRTPPWPLPITTDLPSRDICDGLLDCYLRTFEKIYRVLHVPSFKKDYEAFWNPGSRHDTLFLVQLKLVLAIGCATYDDELSLRSPAIQFIYEASTWLAEPEIKARLGIPFLQAQILLIIAKELLSVDGSMIWIAAGALLRTSVYMGLHRDPVQIPNSPRFVSEMRRRLWNTVLEICIQSSMESGGPPMISIEEFDTQPPGNFNDDEITVEHSIPHPGDQLTSTSVAIALRRSFPIRLEIAKFLNGMSYQGSYEEATRLDARLRASYKEMRRTLQQYRIPPSEFEIPLLDFVIRRYLISIHVPFFGPSFLDTTYAFSRNVVIDTALKIFNYSLNDPNPWSGNQPTSHQIELRRLTSRGSGFFRTAPMHCGFLIAVELRNQILEEDGLGPVILRPDLLSVLSDAKTSSLRCIETGETNIKAYLFMSIVSAQIDALMKGISKDEIPKLLVKAAEEADDECLSILQERLVAEGQKTKVGDSLESEIPEIGDEWDIMMNDANFNFTDIELPSWMLSGISYGIP